MRRATRPVLTTLLLAWVTLLLTAWFTPAVTAQAATTPAFTSIAAGDDFTCGLTADGRAYCWGANFAGQLGHEPAGTQCDGSDRKLSEIEREITVLSGSCTREPRAVSGGLVFTALAAGAQHVCGLDAMGVAHCWGTNGANQLGTSAALPVCRIEHGPGARLDLSRPCSRTPLRIAAPVRFTALAAASEFTCGIDPGGYIWCWPAYGDGVDVPQRLASDYSFVSVSGAGHEHACGITSIGHLVCWEWPGALEADAFRLVLPGLRFKAVAVAPFHACAITVEGAAYCWGSNSSGELGIGRAVPNHYISKPEHVVGGHTFRALAASEARTCALDDAGAVYCWGAVPEKLQRNLCIKDRDPGMPVLLCSRRPVRVANALRAEAITLGLLHRCASSGGKTWCWGRNDWGQLGNGTIGDAQLPSTVGGPPRSGARLAAHSAREWAAAIALRSGAALIVLALLITRRKSWIAARTAGDMLRWWGFLAAGAVALGVLSFALRRIALGGILEMLVLQPFIVAAGLTLSWFALRHSAPRAPETPPTLAPAAPDDVRAAHVWARFALGAALLSWVPLLLVIVSTPFQNVTNEVGAGIAMMVIVSAAGIVVGGAVLAAILAIVALRRADDRTARFVLGYGIIVGGATAVLVWLFSAT